MKTLDLIRLVAHRGDQEHAPENSLEAFKHALDGGARWLECDVQFTRDGVPVLFHDENLSRLCGLDSSLCAIPLVALPPLPDGQPIPTLQELLDLLSGYPHATLFMEIKTEIFPHFPIPEVVAKLGGMVDGNAQVIPISFSAEVLEYWWRNRRRQRLGWIGDEAQGAPRIPLAYAFMSNDAFLEPRRPPDAEHVGVYTVNDERLAEQLLELGADLVETDHFSRLKQPGSNG